MNDGLWVMSPINEVSVQVQQLSQRHHLRTGEVTGSRACAGTQGTPTDLLLGYTANLTLS